MTDTLNITGVSLTLTVFCRGLKSPLRVLSTSSISLTVVGERHTLVGKLSGARTLSGVVTAEETRLGYVLW